MVTNDCMSLSIKKINRAESYKWKLEIETLTYTSMFFLVIQTNGSKNMELYTSFKLITGKLTEISEA